MSRLQIKAQLRARKAFESVIEGGLFTSASLSILITIGIIYVLISEAIPLFKTVSFAQFFTDTQWTPLFDDAHYGIISLVCGTLGTTFVALSVAIPFGLIVAIYLSEYAPAKLRELIKPILELLSVVPTVVYGYFALLFVNPMLQTLIPDLPGFNMLSAGLVMGIMIIPYISSLSEDAMRSVPMMLKEGAYAMGSTRFQTAIKVVVPGAFSGITAACILGISRAIGETMVVSIAAGMQPNFTFDPREPAQTLTGYIVQVSLGDLPHGSIGYQTIFMAGLVLMSMTLAFNFAGHVLRKKYYARGM